jgi:MinD-like ATPase involved in chromosome partitioning or flagellar assembly
VVDRVSVLLAAAGEAWEATALRLLDGDGLAVLKRCVDLADLLASAATGQADVAVVSGELGGLDADAVMQLLRDDVRCVAVGGSDDALARIGVVAVVAPSELAPLPEIVGSAGVRALVVDPDPLPEQAPDLAGVPGRMVAVHGPAGAPGRTTLAIGLAAEHARRGNPCVLVDADPHGGAVAQHLGVLDEVSGLLAAARLVNSGSLDAESFARCRRVVADRFEVLTGLPRPDRWVEARPGVLDAVLERAAEVGDVVVDTGFSLEDDADLGRPLSRNQLTLDAVAMADEVVVVGSAEPTGLARLARTLVELRDSTSAPVTVVVNRMRDSLGWSRRDIVGMVEGYVRATGVHFLPEDRSTTDKALVAGRSVVELGDSPLHKALTDVHAAVFATQAVQEPPPISR